MIELLANAPPSPIFTIGALLFAVVAQWNYNIGFKNNLWKKAFTTIGLTVCSITIYSAGILLK